MFSDKEAKRRFGEIGTFGLLHGVLHIYQSVLPPIYLLIQEEFQVSTLQLGLIGSIVSLTNVLQGPTGYLSVKIGRKRLTLIGMLIYSAALFLYGLAPSFLFLLLMVGVAGVGGSTFHPATYSMVAERAPKKHVTKSMAYHQFGGFLGGAIGVALVGTLAAYLGWRNAIQVLVIPGLIIIALFWIVIKDIGSERSVKETKKSRQETKNGETPFKITLPLLIIILAALIGTLGGGVGRFLPMFLSLEYGESVAWAGILTGIMQGVGCISLMIGGVVADKFDKVNIISTFSFLTGLAIIVLAIGSFSSELLLLLLVFWGFVQYFAGPARHALIVKISGTRPQGIGLEFAGIAIGGIFGDPITGYLIDTFGLRPAFLILTIFTFLSGTMILLLKKWPGKRREIGPS